MKRDIIRNLANSLILLVICMVSISMAESSSPLGMVTGSSSGTYIQFGKQIADIARNEGIEILVKTLRTLRL